VSIIKSGAYMLIGLFLILVIYFVISGPLETIFDGFDDADTGEATGYMNIHLPWIRTALNIAFSVAIVTPVMIFIFRTFERDPEWYYYRRY